MSTLPAPIAQALAPFAPALFGASFNAPDDPVFEDQDVFEALAWRAPAPDADADDEALLAQGKEWEMFHNQGCEFDMAAAPIATAPTVSQSSLAILSHAASLAVQSSSLSLPAAEFMVLNRAQGLIICLNDGMSI